MSIKQVVEVLKGGAGSGNFGHGGRPGKIGGSSGGGGGGGAAPSASREKPGKFVAAPRFTANQISKKAGSHSAAVLTLGKHLASQKPRIDPDTYKTLNSRGQQILSDVRNPRVGSKYTPGPGRTDRAAIAKDLNDLADKIDAASK